MSICHLCMGAGRGQRRCVIPEAGAEAVLTGPMWVLTTELGPLRGAVCFTILVKSPSQCLR